MKRRLPLLLIVLLAILAPLAAGWIVAAAGRENAALAAAQARLNRGELEGALAALEPLRKRPPLTVAGRRRAAELFLRLGEDATGHRMLIGQRRRTDDPEDDRLRAAADRCGRAATLLARAEATPARTERVRLLRQARAELPDAPHVLLRLVQEELLAMAHSRPGAGRDQLEHQFEADYAELRRKAPGLAARLREQLEELTR